MNISLVSNNPAAVEMVVTDSYIRIVRQNVVVFAMIYGDGPLAPSFDEVWKIAGEVFQRLLLIP